MNKSILTIAMVALSATGLFAFGPKRGISQNETFKNYPTEVKGNKIMQTRADAKSVYFTYADSVYTSLGFSGLAKSTQIWEAIRIPKNRVSAFIGDSITSLNITTGCVYDGKNVYANEVLDITVFIKEELEGDPIYKQSGTLVADPFTECEVPLDAPFKITEAKDLYIGFYFKLPNTNQLYITVDGMANNGTDGCLVGVMQNKKVTWGNYANQVGNICMGCMIEGDNLPENGLELMDLAGDLYASPGKPFAYSFLVQGVGLETNDFEITCTVGEEEPQVFEFQTEEPLPINGQEIVDIDDIISNTEGFSIPVIFEITKVNGVPNTCPDNKLAATIDCFPESKGFPRVHAIEEGTGIGCSWCPRGIVMMEYVAEKYPDFFSCIAIHDNIPSRDPMTVPSTSSWVSRYATNGFPTAWIDRTTYLEYMSTDEIDYFVMRHKNVPSVFGFGDIDATVGEDGNLSADIKIKSGFDFDNSDDHYRLGFYLLQNNMGPYMQSNGYAGGNYGEMGGWERKGSSVKMEYNDVVRLMVGGVKGVEKSLPAQIEAGKENTYSATIPVSAVTSDKMILVVWVVDNTTGEICNVKEIEVENPYYSGVGSIESDSNVVSRKFYNLNGVEVGADASGLIIEKSVSSDGKVKTSKIMRK